MSDRSALIVEDDAPIRSLVGSILRRDGFRVDAAANGREAVALLRDREYEVVVLDLAMPEMSGIELLASLKQSMPPALRRVVVMTASIRLLRQLEPMEICRIVTKPFTLEEFRAAVGACAPPSDQPSLEVST